MAKTKEKEVVAPTEATKEVAQAKPQALAMAGASPELLERLREVADNVAAVDNFQLPRVKATSDGLEVMDGEAPVMELEGVVIHAKRTNIYYDKPYNPNNPEPPRCLSMDGIKPDASIKEPINATCKGCPMAEFGTNSMKSGKACRNLKPWYLLLSDESILPRQLTIAPTSLKAADRYLMDLTERGLNYKKVKTKITAYKDNQRDTYVKLKFSMVSKLDAQRIGDVEAIRSNLMHVMNAQAVEQREFEAGTTNNQTVNEDAGINY